MGVSFFVCQQEIPVVDGEMIQVAVEDGHWGLWSAEATEAIERQAR